MRVILVINICVSIVTIVFARPEESKLEKEINTIETDVPAQLTDIKEILGDHPDDINRKKKSTVTTFCVEIRPTNERSFQVCEPSGNKEGYHNAGPYYQTGGGYENLKPQEAFSSGSSVQSKPAYSAPVKTFVSSGSNIVAKPDSPYGSFRSTKPDLFENEKPDRDKSDAARVRASKQEEPFRSTKPDLFENEEPDIDKSEPAHVRASKQEDNEKNVIEPTKLTNEPAPQQEEQKHVSPQQEEQKPVAPHQEEQKPVERKTKESIEEDEDGDDDKVSPFMRIAHPNYRYGYGPGYGHSGLVITCQPNLAGYAHGVPGGYTEKYHRGGGTAPSYNYKSASGYGRPYQNYKPQPQLYGNYKPYATRPIYRPPAQQYQTPAAYYPPAPHKEYKHYAPKTDYKPPAYSINYDTPYRAAAEEENENMDRSMLDTLDKERLTINKMEEVAEKRGYGSRFTDDIQAAKNGDARDADQELRKEDDETVGDAPGGWRNAELPNPDGRWRNPDEPMDWREAFSDQDNPEFEEQNVGKGTIDGMGVREGMSRENQIEDN
ncbi:uncharacterized protein LOC114335658 [Diabrotica virgifera virgifera]|uniref:Uncharacterized protein n=1 Tax=Diabrotica virgifera virgifera TaxID=50390 RepID=A0ABM5ITT7_DIAVI|nr:uncharacterized protein LOC114335658 [Diabrotica virgifera virgifera]